MNYKYFFVLLTPIFIFLLFELIFFKFKIFFLAAFLINLLLFFTLIYFIKGSPGTKKILLFLEISIFPIFLINSTLLYVIIITSKSLMQILFLINSFILYFYLKNIYCFLFKIRQNKTEQVLENVSSYGNFLILFFVSATFFGLQSLLKIPIWILMLFLLPIIILTFYQMMWANRIKENRKYIYILLGSLTLIEIAWSISFLPLNYNVSGLALVICYYMAIGLIRAYLRGSLNKRAVKMYSIVGFSSLILIFLTTRWM